MNHNCLSTTSANLDSCTCSSCHYFSYLSSGVCCPLGTRWNSSLLFCEDLLDPLCAKHDGTSCTECFENPEKRLVLENYTFSTVKALGFILGIANQVVTVERNQYSATYYLNSGVCCPKYTYNKNGSCVAITKTNCKQAEYNVVEMCTLCKDMKMEPDSNGDCVDKSD